MHKILPYEPSKEVLSTNLSKPPFSSPSTFFDFFLLIFSKRYLRAGWEASPAGRVSISKYIILDIKPAYHSSKILLPKQKAPPRGFLSLTYKASPDGHT